MLRRPTYVPAALLLALALASAAPGAAGLRRGARECRMRGMHDCCKRARQKLAAPGVAPVLLCCVVQRPQPAPAGTNFTFQSSQGAASTPRSPASLAPSAQAAAQPREYSPPFHPSHSPPAYIRHAAFLI